MKSKDLKLLRKKYIEFIDKLVKTIENSDCEVDVAGDEVDKLQGASLILIQNQISIHNLNKLRLLERAVEQIDLGEFGDCEECGEEIGIKRLEAIPGCTLCINCAERIELQR